MARTLLVVLLFGLLSITAALRRSSSPHYIDNNPALGPYQDETDCFPLTEAWYVIYRNYAYDPYFGGDPVCVVINEDGPFQNGVGTFTVEYGDSQANVKVTLESSPGYTAKNVLYTEVVDVPGLNFNFTAAYRDCSSCKVMRHSYINQGASCSLWKPASALGQENSCCEFIFDLVCGTSTKYQLYDLC
ncbi:uncharacterized protein LOC144144927 [Haemaphysalis longicornis]